jgi:hypothetical protein
MKPTSPTNFEKKKGRKGAGETSPFLPFTPAPFRLFASSLLCVFALILGCTTKPLKPGKASITASPQQFTSAIAQPENPAQAASQSVERTTQIELPIPARSSISEISLTQNDRGQSVTNQRVVVLAAPTVQTTRITERAGTMIGAAQKDTARELGAKLASLRGIVWVGVGMFLFGLASLFWPPLRAIIGSVTTSIAILAGGVGLMVLPSLIVGHELLILGAIALGVGGWFFAHRHGELRGRQTS